MKEDRLKVYLYYFFFFFISGGFRLSVGVVCWIQSGYWKGAKMENEILMPNGTTGAKECICVDQRRLGAGNVRFHGKGIVNLF